MEPLHPMEETRAWYNRISGVYDLLEGRYEKAAIDAGLRVLDVQPGERVLEIGFGPGHALVSLAGSVGTAGKVSGVDISDEMYTLAKDAVERAGFADRVVLIRADARTLPYADRFFDAVFMSFTLELFSDADIPVLLGECRRVIRSGGRLCVVSLLKTESPGIAGWIYNRRSTSSSPGTSTAARSPFRTCSPGRVSPSPGRKSPPSGDSPSGLPCAGVPDPRVQTFIECRYMAR
jgi:ubiquinone/menaquinone biosynthesis C-methylase UbiE